MTLLGKDGIEGMNHFRVFKQDGNGSIGLDIYLNGDAEPTHTFTSENIVLSDNNWSHVVLAYDHTLHTESKRIARVRLAVNGEYIINQQDLEENGSLPVKLRFANLRIGSPVDSFIGLFDDLRLYNQALDQNTIVEIYGGGGGDFNHVITTGAGTALLTAYQNGNHLYAKATPVFNYISVNLTDQNITFRELPDVSVGDFPLILDANASSGLPVTFSISDQSLATINENLLTIKKAGKLTITAHQVGDSSYSRAQPVSQEITIYNADLKPDSIAGLVLWLDSLDIDKDRVRDEFEDGKPISTWHDRSDKNNNPSNSVESEMPLWMPGTVNGNPVVKFNDEKNQKLTLQDPIEEPFLVSFLAKQNEPLNQAGSKILGGNFLTTDQNGYYSFGYENNGVLISSTRSSTVWSIYSVEFENGTCRLRINGRLEGSSQELSTLNPLDAIGENFSGYIAEIFVFDRFVGKDDRQALEGYLNFKWNLDLLSTLHPYSSAPPTFGGTQYITWLDLGDIPDEGLPNLEIKSISDEDFSLRAIASSGLPVTYVSSDPTIASIIGNIVSIKNVGKVTITAYQIGNSEYDAANPISVELQIVDDSFQKDDQIITIASIPVKVINDEPFNIFATAESSGVNHSVYRLPVSLAIQSGPASIDSTGVISLDGTPGTIVIVASQVGNAFINPAPLAEIEIQVMDKTRPKILFDDGLFSGPMEKIFASPSLITLSGAYADNNNDLEIISSDPEVIKVINGNQVLAKNTGSVTLTFKLTGNDDFAEAITRTRTLEVINPTKDSWIEQRRNDPRYEEIRQKFLDRRISEMGSWSEEQAFFEFDQDNFDSDGDGFSNLYERALGMDSLGFDRTNKPINPVLDDGKPRISYIRLSEEQASSEMIEYIIEESTNLITWKLASDLTLENTMPLAGGYKRVTFVSDSSSEEEKFLRLKIVKLQ
jgi:hypothetical protein